MNDKFLKDYGRSGKIWNPIIGRIRFLKRYDLRFLYWGRKAEDTKFSFLKKYYLLRQWAIGKQYGLEINCATIGGGYD